MFYSTYFFCVHDVQINILIYEVYIIGAGHYEIAQAMLCIKGVSRQWLTQKVPPVEQILGRLWRPQTFKACVVATPIFLPKEAQKSKMKSKSHNLDLSPPIVR